jgi:ubiquinone/menaquinone biosynthesis C-methylase UbiE
MPTYTRLRRNPLALLKEARNLYRIHNDHREGKIAEFVRRMKQFEETLFQQTGIMLENRDILIIGPGQGAGEITYFSLKNRVTGIDLDVIPDSNNPLVYLKMLQQNGAARTVKTLARKLLGVDRRSLQELQRQLNVTRKSKPRLLQMDAAEMTFPDAQFDLVYTFSVFEHLPDPVKVLEQVRRVLKPNGAAYISLHLFTNDTGSHDPRLWTNDPTKPPIWAHLRPEHKDLVQSNAYCNEWRMDNWTATFEKELPGSMIRKETHEANHHAKISQELAELRKQGELSDYRDEELLTINLIALWQKPK